MELVFQPTKMDFMGGAFLWHLLNLQNRYYLETPLNVSFWVLDAVNLIHHDILSVVMLLVALQFSWFSSNTPAWDNLVCIWMNQWKQYGVTSPENQIPFGIFISQEMSITALKVSLFGVILVRIFTDSD